MRRRSVFLAALFALTTVGAGTATAMAEESWPSRTIHGQTCYFIEAIGLPGYANADGVVSAVRVQQYKGLCDGDWKRFAETRVSDAFASKGYWFRASAALRDMNAPGKESFIGWFTSVTRDALVYSHPRNVSQYCTTGVGQVHWVRDGIHYDRMAETANAQGPAC